MVTLTFIESDTGFIPGISQLSLSISTLQNLCKRY